jgi:hypothetical protein
LIEFVDNPTNYGNQPPTIPRVFLELSGVIDRGKKYLANRLLCEWQINLKMKEPDPETGCPYYAASSTVTNLKTFLGAMKRHQDWPFTLDDFQKFDASVGALLKSEFKKRQKKWVSKVLIVMNLFSFWYSMHTYIVLRCRHLYYCVKPSYGTRRKNAIVAEDRDKIRLSMFYNFDHNLGNWYNGR